MSHECWLSKAMHIWSTPSQVKICWGSWAFIEQVHNTVSCQLGCHVCSKVSPTVLQFDCNPCNYAVNILKKWREIKKVIGAQRSTLGNFPSCMWSLLKIAILPLNNVQLFSNCPSAHLRQRELAMKMMRSSIDLSIDSSWNLRTKDLEEKTDQRSYNRLFWLVLFFLLAFPFSSTFLSSSIIFSKNII